MMIRSIEGPQSGLDYYRDFIRYPGLEIPGDVENRLTGPKLASSLGMVVRGR
jgi:hypothetical protein